MQGEKTNGCNRKRKVYFCFFLSSIVCLFCFSGCGMAPDGPKKVLIEDDTYVTGFYGSMFPHEFEYTEESYLVDDTEFRRIEHEQFELVHALVGSYTEGTIYCKESQCDEVKTYYADADNFTYFCLIGTPKKDVSPLAVDISEIDTEKFDALTLFAEKNSYNPFDFKKNDGIEKIELPIPDDTKSPRLVFYKESKDGLFASSKGEYFHIIDGELILVFYYDMGHGEYEKLVAVKVPEELSDYIIHFLNTKM